MPKTSLKKQNYRKYVTSFISFNIDKYNPNKANISGSNSDNSLIIDLKPSFPPNLTINDLIKNKNSNNKPKTIPNAFIAYRMALMNEYRIKDHKLPPVADVSKMAKNAWNAEPGHVKDFYRSLIKDAKSIFKQNSIQIIYDKNMNYTNYVENNQEGVITCNVERQQVTNENLNSAVSVENSPRINIPSIINSSNHDNSDEMNSTSAREEYIKVLEETIEHLLRN
ncbi:hypothetical protein C1645_838552 [Glomus cerebriforme]|uniref:Uncharacterized protein n=1 Tax=Glomus cerebriforme TaxID=658196 RepID=A0A397S3H8_9GLOM|nr:hypothetical protein C1645_838552 [Glomus cerebriforme]